MMVDIDPAKLSARGLSPTDVVNAISAQNLILPGGTRQDRRDWRYDVEMNGSPRRSRRSNDLPIKVGQRRA